MSWKIIFWFVVNRIVFISAQYKIHPNLPTLEKVQIDLFEKLVLQTRFNWISSLPGGNIRFVPLALQTSQYILELREYYEEMAATNSTNASNNLLFARATAFALLVTSRLEMYTNAQVRFKNAIFYDQRYTNKPYLGYVKFRYHAETHEMSFDSDNAAEVGKSFTEWMYNIIGGRQPTLQNPWNPEMTSLQTTLLTFTGCWHNRKTSHKFPKTLDSLLKFKTWNSSITLIPFTAKELMGYYNNPRLKYEAIRIPFKNDQFAMAIVLPYQNHSLELFRRFKEADYLELLERVDEHHQYVEYTLPLMDKTMIVLNENGSSMNGNSTIICDWPSVGEARDETNRNDVKTFYVDRPFGIFIYEEMSKYVLSHVLVRDPSTGLDDYKKFVGKIEPRMKFPFPGISLITSYEVFY